MTGGKKRTGWEGATFPSLRGEFVFAVTWSLLIRG